MKKLKVFVILILVLMLGACSNNTVDANNEGNNEEKSEVVVIDQDAKEDVSKYEENNNSEHVAVIPEKTQEEQSKVMKGFDGLLKQDASSLEISKYVDENIKGLSKKNGTKMVLALEENLKKNIEKVYNDLPNYEQKLYDYDYKEVLKNIEGVKDEELKKFLQEFKDSHYIFDMNEGMYQVMIDYGSLEKYGHYLSEDIVAYFQFKALNSDEYYSEDGGLSITYDTLRERLIVGDNFLSKYKDSSRKKEAAIEYVNYLSFYIYGDNNAPAFDYDTNKLKDEILKSYKKIDLNNDNSKLTSIFKEYLPLLEKSEYTLTEEINKYRGKIESDFMKAYNMTYDERYSF